MFYPSIRGWNWYHGLRGDGIGGLGEWQEVNIHLCRESLRKVRRGDPSCEWYQAIYSIISHAYPIISEGRGEPVSTTPPRSVTQSPNFSFPAWISFLALSRSCSSTSKSEEPPFIFASNIPLSSKHSLIAPTLYAFPSLCLNSSFGSGISPSCEALKFPPGKTCADGKEEEVRTRCRRRISFVGEMRRILDVVRWRYFVTQERGLYATYEALGLGSATAFFGFEPEDMYCFSSSGRGAMTGKRSLQDEADTGSLLKECWELGRGMTRVCIHFEILILLPPVHCLEAMQVSRLRCIE